MTKGIRKLLIGSTATAHLLALGYLLYFGGHDLLGRPLAKSTRIPGAMEPGPRLDSFAGIVDAVKPTVVNISTTRAVGGPRPRGVHRDPEPYGVGSGLLFEPDGYVLTNNHVVESAQTILVRLSDDEEYEARIVGKDAWTDLALLKIQGRRQFPVAPLGDSDRLRVGDRVLAVGNPFGLEQTVTAGIVSAKGRVIGLGPDDDFIQTDAPINPGNSGGPLFNTRGEVVGINSVILSHSGESVGIGLAIPINLVKDRLRQLRGTQGWFAEL